MACFECKLIEPDSSRNKLEMSSKISGSLETLFYVNYLLREFQSFQKFWIFKVLANFSRVRKVELLILEFFVTRQKIIIGFWHFESEVQEKKSETWITFSKFSQRQKCFRQSQISQFV